MQDSITVPAAEVVQGGDLRPLISQQRSHLGAYVTSTPDQQNMHSLRCHFAIHFLDPDCLLANTRRLPMREGESAPSTADLRALQELTGPEARNPRRIQPPPHIST
ncbi:MAG: hypothetical protein ACK6DW_12455 [Betaproteobacteria bacterium]